MDSSNDIEVHEILEGLSGVDRYTLQDIHIASTCRGFYHSANSLSTLGLVRRLSKDPDRWTTTDLGKKTVELLWLTEDLKKRVQSLNS